MQAIYYNCKTEILMTEKELKQYLNKTQYGKRIIKKSQKHI